MKTAKNTALPGAIFAFILLLTNLAPAAGNEANEPKFIYTQSFDSLPLSWSFLPEFARLGNH
jgi:hypothetical protein